MPDLSSEQREARQLREDAAELAWVLIDLLDRGVVSGHKERDRLGTLPALARAVEMGEWMNEERTNSKGKRASISEMSEQQRELMESARRDHEEACPSATLDEVVEAMFVAGLAAAEQPADARRLEEVLADAWFEYWLAGHFAVELPLALRKSSVGGGWEASCALGAELGRTPLDAWNALERTLNAKGLTVRDGEIDYPEDTDA